MAVRTISGNRNRVFAVDNHVPKGTWGSAQLYALHLHSEAAVLLEVRSHGDRAMFRKAELLEIAASLTELANGLPS